MYRSTFSAVRDLARSLFVVVLLAALSACVLTERESTTATGSSKNARTADSARMSARSRHRPQRTQIPYSAPTATVNPGAYYFANACGGRYLEVAGASNSDGAAMQLGEGSGSAHQKFNLSPQADGSFTLTVAHSALLLDIAADSANSGAALVQRNASASLGQHQLRLQSFVTGQAPQVTD